ncbi:MAG: MarR family transcriptional regulator [Burkholderiaceae bacterium]|nr:MAG: MarR family transcriptional regulator [Burkholderiaceae bacterium]TAM04362.1 MAG: MarR family transcriptional regulator [Pusillimonas sp.]
MLETLKEPPKNVHATHSLPPTLTIPELLVDGSDGQFRLLIDNLVSLSIFLHDIRELFGESIGLGDSEYLIVTTIYYLGQHQEVNINDVARRLGYSGSYITKAVGKLENGGYVTKKTSSKDRRKVVVELTSKALEMLRSLKALQQPTNNLMLQNFSKDEFDSLTELCSKLSHNSKKALALCTHLSNMRAITNAGART